MTHTIPHGQSQEAQAFVDWFRKASPYIHAHRGRTFVICFGGEAFTAIKLSKGEHVGSSLQD